MSERNGMMLFLIALVAGIGGLLVVLAWGEANSGVAGINVGFCSAPVNDEVLQWSSGSFCFDTVAAETLTSATLSADEDGIEAVDNVTTIDFRAGFDLATAPGDAIVTLDITEATLTADSIWVGDGGVASEVALSNVNVGSATALAADPSDCASNQFATTIAADGDLTCAAIVDADVPDTITIDLAAAATALASNPTDCAANQFAHTIAASGNLTCSAVTSAYITDGTLLEADLKAVDSASDEECLTYESTGGDFEWQSCGSGGSGASAFEDLTDVNVSDVQDGQLVLYSSGALVNATMSGDATISSAGVLTLATDYISEAELDTEAELEAQLTDVTDVFTNTDGALDDDDLTDNSVDDLSDVVVTSPGDASVLIYSTGSSTWSDFTLSGDCTMTNAGVLTCSNAATADALTNNPTDCGANVFATTIASDGDLTCEAIVDADVPNDITIDLATAASALAANGANCTSGQAAGGVTAAGAAEDCTEYLQPGGVDVSDDLNLTAGRSVTLTGDSIDADAELYTWGFSAGIASVSVDDDGLIQWGLPSSGSIAGFTCSTSVGTATISVDRRSATSPNSAGDTVFSNLACDTDRQTTTSFTWDTTTPDYIWSVQIEAVSTPGVNLRISSATGTYDD